MEKPMTRNVQKTLGIRVALVAAVAFPLIIAMSARAQDAAASPAAPTTGSNIPPTAGAPSEVTSERVVVTGSNIPTAEEVGPNPVDTYRRDDITRLGVRTPTDLIERLPAATGSTTTENNTNGGDGSTRVDLRGIDPKETLVLEDNRRLANVGFAGSSPDFNMFPLGLIDHIDILKDGASPIYGSEAVSGVVNVFLIHRFRGLELYASYGNTNLGFAGDRGEETMYLLAGTGDDKTNIVVYAGYYNAAAVYSRDLNISHDADHLGWNGEDTRSGNFARRVQGSVYQPALNGGSLTPTPHAFPNAANDPQYVPRGSLPYEQQLFNFADLTPDIAATDRTFLYGSFDRDLCDKYLTVFADFKYVRQFWDGGLAPAPFTPDIWTDINNPFGISAAGFSVPTQNAFNPFTVADYTSPGGTNPGFPDTQASAAPPGTQFTTGVRYRSLEAGLRTDKITTDNVLFTFGLKGNLGEFADAWDKLKTWEWETAIRWNEDYRIERFGGIINNNGLRAALLDTDPATAFNPFGANVQSAAAMARVYVTTNHIGWTTLLTEDFRLNGDIFDLPGGPVSMAMGTEHLTNKTSDNPDALTASGQTTGATNFAPTKGSRDSWSQYWEFRVPVTGPTWNLPGFYSLELDYAERYENFSDFGETERPKFSFRWQPFDTALLFRGAYIEAFHAPALGELFSGATQSFPNVKDPQSSTATTSTAFTGTEPQVQEIISGNPNLKPEIAYEYTYGGVITPGKWWAPLQGLTVSTDFVHIDLRGFTSFLSAQFLLDHEAEFPGQVVRGPPGANGGNNPVFGPVLNLFTPLQNLGREVLSAWDYEAVEIFETNRLGHGDWGTFTATFNGTYLADVDVQATPNGKRFTAVGQFGGGFQGVNGGGSYTHNRWYASLFYDGPSGSWLQGVDAGAVVHYVGQYWDNKDFTFLAFERGNASDRKVREWTTVDLILNYTFNLPPPAAQTEVAGYAKDGGKNVSMKDGKEKNVMPVSTAEYNPCGWRAWLNNTTLTLGIDNVADLEPPFVAASFENGYDEETANAKGRVWYAAIKHRF
jgi:iron complex outermembrane receptor protein